MLSLLLVLQGPLNYGERPWAVFRGTSQGHSVEIRLKAANFAPLRRRIVWIFFGEHDSKRVLSGKLKEMGSERPVAGFGPRGKEEIFYGNGGARDEAVGLTATQWLGKHNTQLTSFKLKVDGKTWKVPKALYEDCLSVHVETASATVSKDGKTVRITAGASDGAGGYLVTWAIRSNGRNTRNIEVP